jgi:rhodanese-related sulfurtransferase
MTIRAFRHALAPDTTAILIRHAASTMRIDLLDTRVRVYRGKSSPPARLPFDVKALAWPARYWYPPSAMNQAETAAILDVRAEARFAAGHAAGAANIPLEELAARSHELPPKGAAVNLFDDDPERRRQAAEALRLRGYAVREVSLPADDLRESGPSRARLWRPSPFLVEALDCIRLRADFREPAPAKPSLAVRGEALATASLRPDPPRSEEGRMAPRALDLACGAGREAVYLALAGYEVDAVDVLPDALARAQDLARRCGVRLSTIQQDLRRSPALPAERYDMVIVFRFLHRPLLPAIGRSVARGGFIVYEAFHRRDAGASGRACHGGGGEGRAVGSPAASAAGANNKGCRGGVGRTLQDGELAAAFDGFEPLIARDGVERDGRVFSQLLARRR